jgi:hypothetical protein
MPARISARTSRALIFLFVELVTDQSSKRGTVSAPESKCKLLKADRHGVLRHSRLRNEEKLWAPFFRWPNQMLQRQKKNLRTTLIFEVTGRNSSIPESLQQATESGRGTRPSLQAPCSEAEGVITGDASQAEQSISRRGRPQWDNDSLADA